MVQLEKQSRVVYDCPYPRKKIEYVDGSASMQFISKNRPAAGTFLAWWNTVCNKFKVDDVCVVAMTLWAIWNNQNDWVWNGKHVPAVRGIGSALNLLSQWTVAQKSFRKTSSIPVAEGDFKWARPEAGRVKCNIDGSVFEDQGKVGFGFVIRNDLGHFLHARNGSTSAPLDPLLAEATSCREALSWIKDARLSNVCVEADSLILILALRGDFSDSSYIGSVIQDRKILEQDILGKHVCLWAIAFGTLIPNSGLWGLPFVGHDPFLKSSLSPDDFVAESAFDKVDLFDDAFDDDEVNYSIIYDSSLDDIEPLTGNVFESQSQGHLDILVRKISALYQLEGYVKERLLLGHHHGNRFTITLRGVVAGSEDIIKSSAEAIGRHGFINYFSLQKTSVKTEELPVASLTELLRIITSSVLGILKKNAKA
ncbi:hypothetical protein LguiA_002973 [Lonicera macranthoides]